MLLTDGSKPNLVFMLNQETGKWSWFYADKYGRKIQGDGLTYNTLHSAMINVK